jgi:hypothetical protein
VAMSGRNIIQQICREDKRSFRATIPILENSFLADST